MSPRDLSVGHAYYQVTYADNELTVPGVDPMIYVGLNIFPDDDPASKTYYFQDPVSHSWKGPVTDPTHNTKHPEIETLPSVRSSVATIHARACLAGDFKNCCMLSGEFDGSDRHHFFPRVTTPSNNRWRGP
jgi:hypothetical protein